MKKQFNEKQILNKKCNMLTAVAIEKIYGKRKANQYSTMIKCICDCGNYTYLYPYQFLNKQIKSCGCVKHLTPYNATHKESKSNLYHIWETMRLRCKSSNNAKYYLYGARGISVCSEWDNDYLNFKKWALANGYKKGLSIDRIDNNGNYEPKNCRWATREIQQRNRRNCIMITYNNKTQCLADWCDELNLNYKTIYGRISKGWDTIKALKAPINKNS